MLLDVKPFVGLLKKEDAKRAREWLELNKGNANPTDEFERGYLLALQGMASALESGGELSTINKILKKRYALEQVNDVVKDAKAKLSQKFRLEDERGFHKAWIDVIQELSGEKS